MFAITLRITSDVELLDAVQDYANVFALLDAETSNWVKGAEHAIDLEPRTKLLFRLIYN